MCVCCMIASAMKKIIQIISLASKNVSVLDVGIVCPVYIITINLYKSSSSENDLHSYVSSPLSRFNTKQGDCSRMKAFL